jgi:hypothetical protein
MPHGYFTIEQWHPAQANTAAHWTPILHLDSSQSLTQAIAALEKHGGPGLFRVLQMQRCIWAELEHGKLRLHRSHASSPDNLAKLTHLFEREHGRRPTHKSRQDRARAKAKPNN